MGTTTEQIAIRARKRIQEQIEREELIKKQTLLKKRIDLANSGVQHYERKNIKEAVQAFHSYIKILEYWKGCPEGGLKPTMFDRKTDIAEMLLISGVYWDLIKLYDRTTVKEKQKDFLHYLEKYIQFSKGMPYEPLCMETLRKYISNDKPVHVSAFKAAYKTMGGKNCFIATALLDDTHCETLPTLREFRDTFLLKNQTGRSLVSIYYVIGPHLAWIIERMPDGIRKELGLQLDRVAKVLKLHFKLQT